MLGVLHRWMKVGGPEQTTLDPITHLRRQHTSWTNTHHAQHKIDNGNVIGPWQNIMLRRGLAVHGTNG